MDLNCQLALVGGRPVVVVQGEIDLATAPQLRDQLARAIHRHPAATVVVDLDGVTVLDDSGLGVLLGAAGAARTGGGELELVASSPALIARFESTGMARAITVRDRVTPS